MTSTGSLLTDENEQDESLTDSRWYNREKPEPETAEPDAGHAEQAVVETGSYRQSWLTSYRDDDHTRGDDRIVDQTVEASEEDEHKDLPRLGSQRSSCEDKDKLLSSPECNIGSLQKPKRSQLKSPMLAETHCHSSPFPMLMYCLVVRCGLSLARKPIVMSSCTAYAREGWRAIVVRDETQPSTCSK